MSEIEFPSDGVTECNGGGLLAGEQEQKILQLIAMNHSMKRACDDKDAEIAALREEIASHAAWAKGFAADPANGAIMAAQAEIAALREAVRKINRKVLAATKVGEPRQVLWDLLKFAEQWSTQEPAVRRALEVEP